MSGPEKHQQNDRAAGPLIWVLVAASILAVAVWIGLRRPADTAPSAPAVTVAATFVGSAACADCHAAEHAAWGASQHAAAMQEANESTVLGRFDDADFTASDVTARFFRRDGRYMVRTDGPDGKPAAFDLKYSFGVYPLQQYLVPFPDGRMQALGIAWDARSAEAGGQRWFHLYPANPPKAGDPLHWTGIDQNWNYQCADCHSTELRKNFDAATGKFATTWSEISVGCESCHGPASTHVAWARGASDARSRDATKGLTVALDERLDTKWIANPAGTAARSKPRVTTREIDTCADCHSRRGQFSDRHAAGDELLDSFRPALLEPGLYYADGQQRDEVYTWGSFMQSRMQAVGVTCADCHDPHAGKLRAQGNAVCAQCHAPAVFDDASHHHHAAGSTGSQCVACHMPPRTYMVVDPRHDHSLRIPRPDLSVTLGTPNACNACHGERGATWAANAVTQWFPQRKTGFQNFAQAFDTADRGAPGAAQGLAAVILDAGQPALVRASALLRLGRHLDPGNLSLATRALSDPQAIVRMAAVDAIATTDGATRAEQLAPLLGDPVRVVRMDAARALAGEPEARLLEGERAGFTSALNEWIAAQKFNAERPEAQTNLGSLQLERGATAEAIASFQKALELDPTFVQAAVNLADVHRALGEEAAAEQALRGALERNPMAAAVHHALGLSLIRQRRTPEALAELKKAATIGSDEPRFVYVYGVALHDTGDAIGSLAALGQALKRHPYDRDILTALVAYERESGKTANADEHGRRLRALDGDSGAVNSGQ